MKCSLRISNFLEEISSLSHSIVFPLFFPNLCLVLKASGSWVHNSNKHLIENKTILWPPYAKSWLILKDPDAGKDWGLEEKGTTEDKMVGWHHRLDEHGFGWTLGFCDGQGGLACCGSWGYRESDMTEWLNWTEKTKLFYVHRILE